MLTGARASFMRHHAGLLDAASWQVTQRLIAADEMPDVFPYAETLRFCNLFDPL